MTIQYTLPALTRDNANWIDFGRQHGAIPPVGQTVEFVGSNFIDAVFDRPGSSAS
jgi:hypothetical protein